MLFDVSEVTHRPNLQLDGGSVVTDNDAVRMKLQTGDGPHMVNAAFNGLTSLKKKDRKTVKKPEKQASPPQGRAPDEAQCFLEAMSDVEPLS